MYIICFSAYHSRFDRLVDMVVDPGRNVRRCAAQKIVDYVLRKNAAREPDKENDGRQNNNFFGDLYFYYHTFQTSFKHEFIHNHNRLYNRAAMI